MRLAEVLPSGTGPPPSRADTIERWQQLLDDHCPEGDHRWVDGLEDGLTGITCKVRTVDLLHLFAEYALTMLTLHEAGELSADVSSRMERVLAALYSDQIIAEVEAIKARYPTAARASGRNEEGLSPHSGCR